MLIMWGRCLVMLVLMLLLVVGELIHEMKFILSFLLCHDDVSEHLYLNTLCNDINSAAPTCFVPAALIPQLERCRDAFSLLDASNLHPEEEGGRTKSLINVKLVPVNAGDEILLKGINYGSKTR